MISAHTWNKISHLTRVATLSCKVGASAILWKLTMFHSFPCNREDVTEVRYWYSFSSYFSVFNFCEMTSVWRHINVFRVISSSTVHQVHISLVTPSNCCIETPLDFWLLNSSDHNQADYRVWATCGKVFIRQASTVLNWNSGWFSSGPVLTIDTAIDQCRKRLWAWVCVKGGHFQHIMSTQWLYDLLCDWLVK